MRSPVSSGHFTCTQCTSAMRSMPASAIACFTAAAVASIWAARPISWGSKSRVAAMPMASRFSPSGDGARRRRPRENRGVRAEHAFGAAGHHHGDPPFDLGGGGAEIRRERRRERRAGVFAGEVVDAAIALGLDEDRDDRRRIERARLDQASLRVRSSLDRARPSRSGRSGRTCRPVRPWRCGTYRCDTAWRACPRKTKRGLAAPVLHKQTS